MAMAMVRIPLQEAALHVMLVDDASAFSRISTHGRGRAVVSWQSVGKQRAVKASSPGVPTRISVPLVSPE